LLIALDAATGLLGVLADYMTERDHPQDH